MKWGVDQWRQHAELELTRERRTDRCEVPATAEEPEGDVIPIADNLKADAVVNLVQLLEEKL